MELDYTMSELMDGEINGIPFVYYDSVMVFEGVTLNQRQYFRKIDNYIILITIGYFDESELHEMLAILDGLQMN
jgi:hypothetical protein